MKFDANLAWKDALVAIKANRDTLLALAGVFFLLPALAYAVLYPQPTLPAGAMPEAGFALMREHLLGSWPGWLPMALLQAVGTLAALELLTGSGRPTVGEAIQRGCNNLLPYIGTQLLFGLVIGLAVSLAGGLAAVTGSTALSALTVAAAGALTIYGLVRTGLVAPIILAENLRNPVEALKRSLELTKGKFWSLLGFTMLIAIAAFIISQLASMTFGLIFNGLGGPEVGRFGEALASSTLSAMLSILTAALLAAVYRQFSERQSGAKSHG